ncbi:MAG: Gfo/Idh/MocA family oxidoreductase [Chitinophagaceae bacterium]|nr:Gfo/Idh/MocA family oxidoreductase [Chitinophagaceae bacterium]
MQTRRQFLNDTSRLAAATGFISFPGALNARITKPSDTINIALIGCRGMGFGDLQNALKVPGIKCIGLCDIDRNVLAQRKNDVIKLQGSEPIVYSDFRKMLDNKDIDAVIIGTPDHWHCLPFIAACEAGKEIYVEKPLANSLAECELMMRSARRHKRIVQVGQQQRSGPHFINAVKFIQDGKIGQVRKVNVWGNFNYGIGQPVVPDSEVPAGVDYDMWLGPAPKRNFNKNRFHSNWRMFWDYGGGLLTDWGVHLLDVALWAMDVKTMPLSVTATGGNFAFADHAHETFDTMSVSYQLKDLVINWEHTAGIQTGPYNRSYGLAFVGNNGTLVIDRNGWELIPEVDEGKYKTPAVPKSGGSESHELHMRNFIESVREKRDPVCTIEMGRLVAMYAHFGNIALKTNSRLVFDEQAFNFGDNSAANALIAPAYRTPWVLPKI